MNIVGAGKAIYISTLGWHKNQEIAKSDVGILGGIYVGERLLWKDVAFT